MKAKITFKKIQIITKEIEITNEQFMNMFHGEKIFSKTEIEDQFKGVEDKIECILLDNQEQPTSRISYNIEHTCYNCIHSYMKEISKSLQISYCNVRNDYLGNYENIKEKQCILGSILFEPRE